MMAAPVLLSGISHLGSSRVLIVALALIPVLLVAIASLPAIVVVSFRPTRSEHLKCVFGLLLEWTTAILTHSRVRR